MSKVWFEPTVKVTSATRLPASYFVSISYMCWAFRRACLIDTYLVGATLTRADFTDADLTGANLLSSNLVGADFTGAVLTDANLDGSIIADTIFTGAIGWNGSPSHVPPRLHPPRGL